MEEKEITITDILQKYNYHIIHISKTILSIMPLEMESRTEDFIKKNYLSLSDNSPVDFITLQFYPERKKKEE